MRSYGAVVTAWTCAAFSYACLPVSVDCDVVKIQLRGVESFMPLGTTSNFELSSQHYCKVSIPKSYLWLLAGFPSQMGNSENDTVPFLVGLVGIWRFSR